MLAVSSLNLCVTACRKWFLVHAGVALFFFFPNQRDIMSAHTVSVDADSKGLGQNFLQTGPDLRSTSPTSEQRA